MTHSTLTRIQTQSDLHHIIKLSFWLACCAAAVKLCQYTWNVIKSKVKSGDDENDNELGKHFVSGWNDQNHFVWSIVWSVFDASLIKMAELDQEKASET